MRVKCVNKWCFVPGCTNTSKNNEQKIFITIPRNLSKKKKWFIAARKKLKDVSVKTVFFCCEDHFNLAEDMENYYEYKFSKVHARMKPEVVPHIFSWQTDKKSVPRITSEMRSRKRKISEILNVSESKIRKSSTDSDDSTTITQPSTSNSPEGPDNSMFKTDFSCQTDVIHYSSKATQVTFPTNVAVKNVGTSPRYYIYGSRPSE